MSETPVGQPPATGGRTKVHASAAERARAWRQRQKEAGAQPVVPDSPELAVASLAGVVSALRDLLEGAQDQIAQQVEQALTAVQLLADPDAVDEKLELARAEVGRQVAEAEDRAARARTEASRARAGEEAATAERDRAVAEAAEAWEQTTAAEAAAGEAAAARAAAEESAASAQAAVAAAQERAQEADLAAQVARAEAESVRGELAAVREDQQAERVASQQALAEVGEQLRQVQQDLDAERLTHAAEVKAAREAAQRAEVKAVARQDAAVTAAREVLTVRLEGVQHDLETERGARASEATAAREAAQRAAAEASARQEAAVASAREVLAVRLEAAQQRLGDLETVLSDVRQERDAYRVALQQPRGAQEA